MKLIFLDIDGVMNHRNYMDRSRLHSLEEFCSVAVRWRKFFEWFEGKVTDKGESLEQG